jgi:hypothetical protein
MISHVVPFGKGYEMVALATNLVRSGSYANPFSVLATGPTAANPPLYPLLLALLFKIFPTADLAVFAATLGNILANAFTAVLLPRISEAFYGDRRPGIVAGVFWILAAPLIPSWDASICVLSLLLFCLKTETDRKGSGVGSSAIISGLLGSALFFFNPSTLLITVPWMAWVSFRSYRRSERPTLYFGLVIGVMLVAGGGWALRNRADLGRAVVRTNLGMTLYASNNSCASPSLLASEASNCYQAHHPNTNIQEAALIRTLGEIKYDRMRVHDSITWINSHPHRFTMITIARICEFWLPIPGETPFKSVVVWIATILSLPGLFLMIRRRVGIAPFVYTVLLIYPLMYYIVVSDIRYRIPVLWLSLLPCGWFLVSLWDRRPNIRFSTSQSWPRKIFQN